jgi:hypothetical protein
MPHFTKEITTHRGTFNFYFNRIFTVNGTKYHVSVRGGGITYYFMMEEEDGKWKVSTIPMPSNWIIDLETELEKAILEHQQAH